MSGKRNGRRMPPMPNLANLGATRRENDVAIVPATSEKLVELLDQGATPIGATTLATEAVWGWTPAEQTRYAEELGEDPKEWPPPTTAVAYKAVVGVVLRLKASPIARPALTP